MALIKTFKDGNCVVNVYDDAIPKTKEGLRKNLIRMYDTVNKIAWELEKKGVDTSSWFYTPEQIQKMKESGKYNFI